MMHTRDRWYQSGSRKITEETLMLCDAYYRPRLSEFDQQVFRALVPQSHYLRKALQVIRWDNFYEVLAPYYNDGAGRPAESPVLMLKLEYLRYHDNLSDRQVIARSTTDVSYRYFLQLGVNSPLPDPSSLCYFRGRLGGDGFRKVFRDVIHQSREQGLIKDRLRIKDASHVIANIAVPTTLALVARIRDELLAAAEVFDGLRVAGERVNIDLLRQTTAGQNKEQRLVARVTHLREIVMWADELTPPAMAAENPAWQTLVQKRRLAHKILADQENPEAGDRTLSTVDPEARRGKHGEWYDGYVVDISMDPDSELITELNVLAAGGDEAADAITLIRQEEEAHGNDVQALSIDGVGFNGPMLRELQDPEGLAVDTFVPPPKEPASETFTPEDFVADPETGQVRCPAGQTSSYRERDQRSHAWILRFKRKTCEACPLLGSCMSHPPRGHFGKSVRKNEYDTEYRRARQKATTAAYQEVRAEHPMVERKLGEMLNRHGGRRAHYWGPGKVLVQELMAALATNVKRIVRCLCAPTAALEGGS
jgi:transposase